MGTLAHFCITAFAKIISTGSLFISDRVFFFAQIQWKIVQYAPQGNNMH